MPPPLSVTPLTAAARLSVVIAKKSAVPKSFTGSENCTAKRSDSASVGLASRRVMPSTAGVVTSSTVMLSAALSSGLAEVVGSSTFTCTSSTGLV